ncbi:MAG: L-aspartate oxidase, L-aspartate oxidase [Candidatus Peregrinibacteria bacterium GW2011_GWF2_38_29]|nr:MAG: L-aspartate oxidase, L-aspartate oxidase [Candidatus Peregrinibacteria bacterium GW2011_GWF2_38_29]HBB02292.1 L-aspartate oxidase [Candidatus Peregrinibacteria bacterium]
MKFDFIIVGSGIAGLNSALNASKFGKVLIITKKRLINSNTNFAQGGIAAVLNKTDNFKKHVEDTMTAGCFHNNKRAVEFMVKNGPKAIKKLMQIGVHFEIKNPQNVSNLSLTREGGHSEYRIAYAGDHTGAEIEKTLIQAVKQNKKITIFENAFALDLITENKICYGIQIIRNNKIENIFARAVILATGGTGQVYKYTTNPEISTGDGIAMGLRAGAKAEDMEFIQFHPTALAIPRKPLFLLSESLRGEGAILINSKGERFMKRAHKLAELAPRDIVAREIYAEQKSGTIFLDISHEKPDFIRKRFPKIYSTLKKNYNLDLTKDKIPVTPAAHYLCGGIKVNLNCSPGIKNLYAFGEMTCTGVHGANRLASNSLLEAMVFSEEITKQLKNIAKTKNLGSTASIKTIKIATPKIAKTAPITNSKIAKIKEKIQFLMWQNTGILRTTKQLKENLKELSKLENLLPKNETNMKIAETKNMILVSQIITESALLRKKSIGCHFIS